MKLFPHVCSAIACAVVLSASPAALAQTCNATYTNFITQGRTYLIAQDLTNANNAFSNAVSLCPSNATANAFWGMTRLLTLSDLPAGKAFLDKLGFAPTNRTVYNWTAEVPEDTNGVPLAPTNMSGAELTAFLRTNILVEITNAWTNLSRITDTNFLLYLTENETRTVDVTVDYGDVQLIRSGLQFALYAGYTLNSWNFDYQLTALRSAFTNDATTKQSFLQQFTNLLTFVSSNDFAAAKVAFSNAATLYTNASFFITHRPTNIARLFNYDPNRAQREVNFRTNFIALRDSLTNFVKLPANSNLMICLSNQFTGAKSPRAFFPQFVGNVAIAGTLPDTNFGGLVKGLKSYDIENYLGNRRHLPFWSKFRAPQKQTGGRIQYTLDALEGSFLDVQFSTDFLSWTDLTNGFVQQGVLSFTDTNSPGARQKFYRTLDMAHGFVVSGKIVDLNGIAIANAQIELSFPYGGGPSITGHTDASGNFFLTVPSGLDLGSYQLDVVSSNSGPLDLGEFADTQTNSLGTIYLPPAGYAPPNDDFANAIVLTGTNVTTTGFNFGATNEPCEFSEQTIWWQWTAPANFPANRMITIDTIGSSANTYLEVYTNSPCDGFPIAGGTTVEFQVTPGTTYYFQDSQNDPKANPGRVVLHLRATPPRPPTFIYQPPSQTLQIGDSIYLSVGVDGTQPIGFQWRKNSTAIMGETNAYYQLMNVQPSDAGTYSLVASNLAASATSSNIVITVASRPANDNFTNRITIAGSSTTVYGSNLSASSEAGEPNHAGNSGGRSVWWTWTAPSTGPVVLDTIGSTFDTVLAVYTGTDVTNLTVVAADDNGGFHSTSRVLFFATQNTKYQIAVDGTSPYEAGPIVLNLAYGVGEAPLLLSQPRSLAVINGQSASFEVQARGTEPMAYQWFRNGTNVAGATSSFFLMTNVQPSQAGSYTVRVTNATPGSVTSSPAILTVFVAPGNDMFSNRFSITGLSNSVAGTNGGATLEPDEPRHDGNAGGSSVWWTWTAPTNGAAIIDTIGSSFDTILAVYTGEDLSELVPVASDDDGGGNGASRVAFTAVAGTNYQIAVDGFNGAFGTINLKVVLGAENTPAAPVVFTVLHTFAPMLTDMNTSFSSNVDGTAIYSALLQGRDGRLYGTTTAGGTNDTGTIFALNPNGTGFRVLHTFGLDDDNNVDGAFSYATLVQGVDGRLYGTTSGGGTNESGTIFALNTNGTGFTVLHRFDSQNPNDGGNSYAGLLQLADGKLYGTTANGGNFGYGTIFVLTTNGDGFTLLHSFSQPDTNNANLDGAIPNAPLMQGLDGGLYGTTSQGGLYENGTVFELALKALQFFTLHHFAGAEGASPPRGLMQASDGRLYGVTPGPNLGVVYGLDGSGKGFAALHCFDGLDGSTPFGTLVQTPDGLLYGASSQSGTNESGTLFSVKTSGENFSLVYQFSEVDAGSGTNSDGAFPIDNLIQGVDGRFYGCTSGGGTNAAGVVFAISLAGPSLQVQKGVGAKVVLSWPAWASNYSLETANSLSNGATWTTVTGAVLSGQSMIVTNSATAKASFFRLHLH